MVATYRNHLIESDCFDADSPGDVPDDIGPGEDPPANPYMAYLEEGPTR
ncbi:hypothetical protein [Halosimplex pelagicum]|nr:hypothetical protein [Halosimplex pelagicum]